MDRQKIGRCESVAISPVEVTQRKALPTQTALHYCMTNVTRLKTSLSIVMVSSNATMHGLVHVSTYHKVGLQRVVDDGLGGVVSAREEVEGQVLYGRLKVRLLGINEHTHSMAFCTLQSANFAVSWL